MQIFVLKRVTGNGLTAHPDGHCIKILVFTLLLLTVSSLKKTENGHTLGFCPYNQKLENFESTKVLFWESEQTIWRIFLGMVENPVSQYQSCDDDLLRTPMIAFYRMISNLVPSEQD